LSRGSKCILPDLDEHQTNNVIEAIYRRFPDMPMKGTKSSFGKHFTTLGI
jgi:hypothetical protein